MDTKCVNARSRLVVCLLAVICIAAGSRAIAQVQSVFNADSASEVDFSSLPATGCIFRGISGKFPPSPFDPYPQLTLYTDGTPGTCWLDDTDSDFQAGGAQGNTFGNGEMAMDAVPAPPGDGGDGGTNSPDGGGTPEGASFSTNGLWLEITGMTNDVISFNLNNASNEVYELYSVTDLTETNWNIETAVFPTNQQVMPFTIAAQGRTNLFVWARDWTGITSDGNLTIQEWWLWEYFGTTDVSETNVDASGNELVNDYLGGGDPNIINFWLSVTGQYFNTSSASVQITVTGGVPSYMAALTDDTNWADANWTPYNANLVANLGNVDGWHTVWVGLRGLPPNAQQTWTPIRLKLTLTPPVVVITNPIPGLVTQPMIEIQGFCAEPLASLNFDLSNAAGFFPNQPAFVLSQHTDANTLTFTTNTFQAFDVPLTNGANVVTFHATDLAGNVTTTNFTYTLDYSGKTNPPAIQVFWPQNGDQISGTKFTLRGSLDDFTASLTAQIIDSSGNTNSVQGLVERNGLFWVENTPLLEGTNYVTLTAMDAVGNISSTNLTISVSAGLTIDDFSSALGGDERNVIPSVTGTIGLTGYILWVNGIAAEQDGRGNWEADSVPVGPGGTAVVEARAIPNSDNDHNGAGTGMAPSTDGTPGNPTAADSMAAQEQIDQPAFWYQATFNSSVTQTGNASRNCCCPATESSISTTTVSASYMAGGTYDGYASTSGADCNGPLNSWLDQAYSWPCDSCFGTAVSTGSDGQDSTNTLYIGCQAFLAEYEASEEFNGNMHVAAAATTPEGSFMSDNSDAESKCSETDLQTGGKGIPGHQNLFEISVSGGSYPYADLVSHENWYWVSVPMSPSQMTVLGQSVGNDGIIYTVLPDNTTVDVTPQAPQQSYYYSVGAIKYLSSFTVYVDMPAAPPNYVLHIGAFWGHAWWSFDCGAPLAALNKFMTTNQSHFVNEQVGYAPNGPVSLLKNPPGYLRDPETDGNISVRKQYEIGFNDLQNGLTFTQNLKANPGIYVILFDNCVWKTVEAGGAAGLRLPYDVAPENFGWLIYESLIGSQ